MTECYPKSIRFSSVKRRKVEVDFSGGSISGNGGIGLLSEVDRRLGLSRSVARSLTDSRRQASCGHRLESLLKQRIYALALGYEDLNDHCELRHDLALQTAAGRVQSLASPSTLCRLERRADRKTAVAIHKVLFEQFVSAHPKPPRRLILDFDATDTPLHGDQEDRFFHAYYDGYCYLPLYVFCGRHLLVSYLRPSGIDAARHAWGILSLLVRALRARWPKVEIIFRGDSGFCRWKMLRWCESRGVQYIVGMARNRRLQKKAQGLMERAEQAYQVTGRKQRLFGSVWYGARTWDRSRRVIVKAEQTARGANPRFVVTNLKQTDRYLYDQMYCARGDMENRIFGPTDGSVCRTGFLSPFLAQPVSAVAVGVGLYPDRGIAPHRAEEYGAGRGQSEPHSSDPVADRSGGTAQYPPHPAAAFQRLSTPGFISYRGLASGLFLTLCECCPGTLTNNGGRGRCVQNPPNGSKIAEPNRKTNAGAECPPRIAKIIQSHPTRAISGLVVEWRRVSPTAPGLKPADSVCRVSVACTAAQ